MNLEQIYGELTCVMQDVFEDEGLTIGPSTTASDVPGWDSQAHVMLIVATEQHFGVRFNTAEFETLRNVGEFAGLIARKLGKAA